MQYWWAPCSIIPIFIDKIRCFHHHFFLLSLVFQCYFHFFGAKICGIFLLLEQSTDAILCVCAILTIFSASNLYAAHFHSLLIYSCSFFLPMHSQALQYIPYPILLYEHHYDVLLLWFYLIMPFLWQNKCSSNLKTVKHDHTPHHIASQRLYRVCFFMKNGCKWYEQAQAFNTMEE